MGCLFYAPDCANRQKKPVSPDVYAKVTACNKSRGSMLPTGIALIAAAIVSFVLAKPRQGVPRLSGNPFLENCVALGITIAGAVGLVTTLVGITQIL
jgi:hypothetical protein